MSVINALARMYQSDQARFQENRARKDRKIEKMIGTLDKVSERAKLNRQKTIAVKFLKGGYEPTAEGLKRFEEEEGYSLEENPMALRAIFDGWKLMRQFQPEKPPGEFTTTIGPDGKPYRAYHKAGQPLPLYKEEKPQKPPKTKWGPVEGKSNLQEELQWNYTTEEWKRTGKTRRRWQPKSGETKGDLRNKKIRYLKMLDQLEKTGGVSPLLMALMREKDPELAEKMSQPHETTETYRDAIQEELNIINRRLGVKPEKDETEPPPKKEGLGLVDENTEKTVVDALEMGMKVSRIRDSLVENLDISKEEAEEIIRRIYKTKVKKAPGSF